MNPLDLPGPEFLVLFIVLLIAAFGVAGLVRWYLRQPGGDPDEQVVLKPYELAFLAGGARRVADAAIAQLVHQGVATVQAAERKVIRSDQSIPPDLSEVEQRVFDTLAAKESVSIDLVRLSGENAAVGLGRRLEQLGLVVDPWQEKIARFVPALIVMSVLGLGVAKIFVGLSRGRPVLFLVIVCVIAVVAGSKAFLVPVLRSRRGDRVLSEITRKNGALKHIYARSDADVSPSDLLLGLSLFGAGVLAGGPLANLQTAFNPPRASSGTGSCGGSSCGGGGCGGGGCGGGGCGGCS